MGIFKIRSFTDLQVWKEAHKLVLLVYKATKEFPKEELYCLSEQIRRCVVSISSNIAEGFSRQTKKEKQQFYFTAKGSLTELQNQILIARDLHFMSQVSFQEIAQQTVKVHKLLNGLLKTSFTRI